MGRVKKILTGSMLFLLSFVWGQGMQISYELRYKPKLHDTIYVKEKGLLAIDHSARQSLYLSTNTSSDFDFKIFKDFKNGIFKKFETIQFTTFASSSNFQPNWQLLPEYKTILGYKTQKAKINFGGRVWNAWYALDIPITDGPYKFYGLPGLILEVGSTDREYVFTCQGIKKIETQNIVLPGHSIEYGTAENELKIKKKIIEDPASLYRSRIQSLKSNGMSMSVSYNGKEFSSADMEKGINEEFKIWQKEHNNPIEKDMLWLK